MEHHKTSAKPRRNSVYSVHADGQRPSEQRAPKPDSAFLARSNKMPYPGITGAKVARVLTTPDPHRIPSSAGKSDQTRAHPLGAKASSAWRRYRNTDADNAKQGTDNANKGADNAIRGTDNANKGNR